MLAARSHRSVGSVLEDALRQMLATADSAAVGLPAVELPVHGRGGLVSGVDLNDKEQVATLIGDDELPRASA